MPVIDEVLMLLEDGEWHHLKEILDKSGLAEFKLSMVLKFLAEYSFIEVEERSGTVRATPEFVQFLEEIHRDTLLE
jgi:DNA-binding IclR family transcriptional regulator